MTSETSRLLSSIPEKARTSVRFDEESVENQLTRRNYDGLGLSILNEPSERSFSSGMSYTDSNDLVLVIVMIVLYVGAGAYAFSVLFDKWTIIDSIYFTVVTFTTCGYGDLYPKHDDEKIFACIFITVGILFIGTFALTTLSDYVFMAYNNIIEGVKEEKNKEFLHQFDREENREVDEATIDDSSKEEDASFWGEIFQLLIRVSGIFALIIGGGIYIGYMEGWSILTSVYFSIVTATSVGYGDVTPESQSMRLFAVFFIPVAVGLMADIFGRLIGVYVKAKAVEVEDEFLSRRMNLIDFIEMDIDGDGQVTKEEFLCFMLISMGKVSKEDLEKLNDLYQKLDEDNSGHLDLDDLLIMANRRRRNK